MDTASQFDSQAAEDIVQWQLDAYNARDIDAFMAFWADDAQVFEHPDKILASGAAEIRARHIVRFQEPDLFGRLVGRMSVGNRVVDREVVTRNFPEGKGTIDVIGIYEVAGGKIARAWFIMGSPILES
ncbi:nuclear transport factor 2 family protein [Ferrovibrio sp.]|uniref:nuclear transport factor 2 family protein n=1 Tax=Ferrovibrio sp. TaxID=1917215 RepID=UPI002624CF11|nr:nuclear transport factor 2 family protein [Ferrovibrio sp.]